MLLAATLPMSTALQVTGGADLIANTLVFAPGGYRFGDYAKVGLPLLLLALVVSVVLAPLIWPLH